MRRSSRISIRQSGEAVCLLLALLIIGRDISFSNPGQKPGVGRPFPESARAARGIRTLESCGEKTSKGWQRRVGRTRASAQAASGTAGGVRAGAGLARYRSYVHKRAMLTGSWRCAGCQEVKAGHQEGSKTG